MPSERTGTVYLVGAGPGDPELLTLKGRRVLAQADCVLFDHLASPTLLDHAPAAAPEATRYLRTKFERMGHVGPGPKPRRIA